MSSQHPSRRLTAGIVGAGIAGLSAAIALRRAGVEVEVYERSRFGNEIGAAISTPPNATTALRRWGFDFDAANTVPNVFTRYSEGRDMRTVFESAYQDIETMMGAPSLSFHRVDLHRGLRALATEGGEKAGGEDEGKGMPVAIRLGCKVKSVDCENGILTLADGSEVRKDLIIIADGAHSTLLADFVDHLVPVQPTGRSIYRWLVSMDDVMADPELAEQYRDKPPGFLCWFDAVKHIKWVNYTCRGGSLLNNAVVHSTKDSECPLSPSSSDGSDGSLGHTDSREGANENDDEHKQWHARASKESVLDTLSNFHPAAQRIVSMASEDGIRVHQLFERPPLENFARGKVAIIGDAAHVMLPTHAAGCAIAIESASVLEVLFKGLECYLDEGREKIIKERLQLFDRLRVPRCNLTMIVSNAGPEGLKLPGVEQEIRKFYRGPLPPEEALPWSEEFREILFHYDAFEVAKQAIYG